MALRTTRQYTEILISGAGALRSTRQYIEILVPVEPEQSISDTLNLSQSIIENVFYNAWTPSGHKLELDQGIKLKGYEWVSNTIEFNQGAVARGAIYRSPWNSINLLDRAKPRNFYSRIIDTLELTHLAPKTTEAEASNTLLLVSYFTRKDNIFDTLSLDQSISHGKTKGLPLQDLGLSQEILISGQWIRSVIDDINILHSVTIEDNNLCAKKDFCPIISDTTSEIDPPPSTLPIVQDESKQFKLEFPAFGGVEDSIELRHPELDNIDQLSAARINRETSGGHLIVFSDSTWAKTHSLKVFFIGLLESEAKALQLFIINHLGEDILLTDWEGREWVGIITSPNEAIAHDGNDNWSASFTFEGILVESNTPDTGLKVEDSVSIRGDWHRKPLDDLSLDHSTNYNCDWDRIGDDILAISDEVEAIVESP